MNTISYSKNLGKKFKCKVSGFTGTCTAVIRYLNGSPQLRLLGESVEGKAPGSLWIEANQLEKLD